VQTGLFFYLPLRLDHQAVRSNGSPTIGEAGAFQAEQDKGGRRGGTAVEAKGQLPIPSDGQIKVGRDE
jgi:hypothetical protein